MPWIRTLAVIFTLFSTAALAQPVIKDGKEWLQPADFVNLSWDDVAVVCDPGTGACSGTLGTTDVTGYTWASVDDVKGLFNAYGVTPPLAAIDQRLESGSSWAPLALSDFDPTDIGKGSRAAWAWASDSPSSGFGYSPLIRDRSHANAYDDADAGSYHSSVYATRSIGAWLYREPSSAGPSPVPTAPTYVLIFTVLGLLVIATRRLSRRNAREG
ncbi:MAG: hypothetical protein GY701_32385 [Sulfitobacter sp.]|nr:hypothetical protein [Sulfitobacter sp.]